MKGWTRRLLRDERGFAAGLIFLVLVGLLIAVITGSASSVQSVTVSDVDLQEAVACAVKAAAMSVSAESQAEGKPRIRSASAHAAFRDALARNMGLDSASLAPLPGSMYANVPRYWLVVYNGYDDYASDGAAGARLYYFNGSAVSESGLSYAGFPASFAVSGSGIVSGPGGTFTVELRSPGVVALVEAEAKKIVGEVPIKAQRWASARIVCKAGACRVI